MPSAIPVLPVVLTLVMSCGLVGGDDREPSLSRRLPDLGSVVLPPLEEPRSHGTETLKRIRGARPVIEAVALAATDCEVVVDRNDPSKLPEGVEAVNQKGPAPLGTVIDLKCVENYHLMVPQLRCYADKSGKGVWRHLDSTDYARPVCEGCKSEDVDHGVPPGLLPRGVKIKDEYFQIGDVKIGQKLPLECEDPGLKLRQRTALCVDAPDGPVWMADASTPLPDPVCIDSFAPVPSSPAPATPKPHSPPATSPAPPITAKLTSQPVPPQPPKTPAPPTRPPTPVLPGHSTPTPGRLSNCPIPKVIDGDVQFNKSHAEYHCAEKFKLQGPKERKCLPNGLWSGEDPKCLPKDGSTCSQTGIPVAVLVCLALGVALH